MPSQYMFGRHWCKKLALCTALIAGVAASAPALANDSGNDNGPTVNTAEGPVRGFTKNGVNTFLGIPYAAPPVGKLRWQPPQAVKKWRDTLDATQFASSCEVTELQSFGAPKSMSEDCLYINVFTTNTRAGGHGRGLPVIVWIYGGGNVEGESNDYDGSKLATGGPLGTPTVVVTFNYRLGLFGFLSEQHLNAEGHTWGNYGILDQQAVLRWVQRNIASFGGDPTRVALGGQSAGAVDTGANVLAPASGGLFNRAIFQSSLPAFSGLPTAATALARGNALAAVVGCSTSACLRQLSAARILQIQGTAKGNLIDPTLKQTYTVGPFVDGTVIPHQPETAFTTGQYNRMPTISGTVADEANFGAGITEYFSGPPQVATTPAQYTASTSAAVLAQYPLSAYGNNPQIAADRSGTDPTKCQTLHVLNLWASKIPTYAYDFTYTKAPFNFPQMPNAYSPTGFYQALAYHTADIQFLFPHFSGGILGVNLDQQTGQPRELQGSEVKLSDQLVAAWTNFAATGNPNGSKALKWAQFKANSGPFLQQDIPTSDESVAQYRSNYKCDFWDASLTYPTD